MSTTQKITLKSLAADLAADRAQNALMFERIMGRLDDLAPATKVVAVTEVKAPAKKAPEGKAFRSAKGKEQAKAQVAALWTKTLADAGVKRAKDLTPAQMDAYRAASKAIWAAVPKTRSTKA